MKILFTIISQVILLSCLTSCIDTAKQQEKKTAQDSTKQIQVSPKSNVISVAVNDTIGKYFHSEGVLVLINKKDKIVKHIKLNTSDAAIQPWSKHLVGGIVGFDAKDNPVLEQPDTKAKSIEINEDNVFIIEDIKGEWVKIACTEMCAVPCGKQLKNGGWIKWRSGDKVLISLYYAC